MTAPKFIVATTSVDGICVVGDRRPIDEGAVARLMDSIQAIGLQTPITLRNDDEADGFVLVTGRHRLEVFKRLGWEMIPAILLPRSYSVIDAELWEIDENLCRSELTEAQEAQALKRRKELWTERAKREVENSGKTFPENRSRGRPEGFAAETSTLTGDSKRVINLKISRAEKIAPDVMEAVMGTEHDKGVVLDVLRKLTHDEQREALGRIQSGASPTFHDAYEFIHGYAEPVKVHPRAQPIDIPAPKDWSDVEAEQKRRLMQVWNGCSPAVQQWFRETGIDTPIMDRLTGAA